MAIKILRYPTLASCLKAHGLSPSSRGYWKWANADGTEHRESMQTAIRRIRRRRCWGFIEDKRLVHVWIGKGAVLRDVVGLLAHEIGHSKRPYSHDRFREEQKASLYAEVAEQALSVAERLLSDG